MAGLIDLVERKELLARMMRAREGMVITIGEENSPREMQVCSIVSASYEVNGAPGVIGVIGPTRMSYERVASLVHYAASKAAQLVA